MLQAAYLFKYDSTHGRYPGEVTCDEEANLLIVDGKKIQFFSIRNPNEVPWGATGADVGCESTGIFTTIEKAQLHIEGGAKKARHAQDSMFVAAVACIRARCRSLSRRRPLMRRCL